MTEISMKPTYTKLAADGSDLPADHPNDGPDKHLAVRVDHPLLKAPIIVSAYRVATHVVWKEVAAAAEAYDANGWKWRAPTVEELFFIADRTNPECRLDPNFFPDAERWEPTWSATPDAELDDDGEGGTAPSGFAWYVGLGLGFAGRSLQDCVSHVRAVRAGQPIGL
jgi:hypothetical protein